MNAHVPDALAPRSCHARDLSVLIGFLAVIEGERRCGGWPRTTWRPPPGTAVPAQPAAAGDHRYGALRAALDSEVVPRLPDRAAHLHRAGRHADVRRRRRGPPPASWL